MAHAGEELALSCQLKGSVLAGETGFLWQMKMDGLVELMPRWEESSLLHHSLQGLMGQAHCCCKGFGAIKWRGCILLWLRVSFPCCRMFPLPHPCVGDSRKTHF